MNNLEKDINPAKSRLEVKKSRVVLHLRKTGEWDHWIDLIAKKPRAGAAAGGGDAAAAGGKGGAGGDNPSDAIMDMMKQMYEGEWWSR